jgi:uncharacterized protein (UPF0335 family)
MRTITEILDDLDAGQAIPNSEVRQLCKYTQRLEQSNKDLSNAVKDLSEQLHDIDCACGDDLSVTD